MTFELWLFTVKNLGQTYDTALMIYNKLSDAEQNTLKKEFETYENRTA